MMYCFYWFPESSCPEATTRPTTLDALRGGRAKSSNVQNLMYKRGYKYGANHFCCDP